MKATIRAFYAGRFINFIGSAFSEFAIPIFLYQSTKSAFHTGMQWVVIALVRVLATLCIAKIPHGKSNKKSIAFFDVLLGLNVLVFLFVSRSNIIVAAYIFSAVGSAAVVIQNGYIDSMIGQLVDEYGANRSSLNAFIQSSQYFGTTVGYSLAYIISQALSLSSAIFIDSVSFFACAVIVSRLPLKNLSVPFAKVNASFSLLFKNRELAFLTISQMCLGSAIYMYNATSIVTIQRDFNLQPSYIVFLKIFELITYSAASFLAIKLGNIRIQLHFLQRNLILLLFIAFALCQTGFQFIFINAALSFLIGCFQPSILGVFQTYALPEERRNFGTARVAAVAIAGSIGAFAGSTLMALQDHHYVFAASCLPIIGSILFFGLFIHHKKSQKQSE